MRVEACFLARYSGNMKNPSTPDTRLMPLPWDKDQPQKPKGSIKQNWLERQRQRDELRARKALEKQQSEWQK